MIDSNLSEIEQTQQELRVSIEASKALAEKSDQLIARHRKQPEAEPGPEIARPQQPA